MIDFGLDKIALIGAVALIVIGPEKLPKVARTVGHLIGKAQRYVADVKAEVNRSIELDELKKMKTQFEDAARGVEQSVTSGIQETQAELDKAWSDGTSWTGAAADGTSSIDPHAPLATPSPSYQRPRKNWRLKRGALPAWYKKQAGVRAHVQSGAARVARHRPRRPQA
jgi:sec-independent protein translocase protein TatB